MKWLVGIVFAGSLLSQVPSSVGIGSASPSGAAGGDLSGTYPNPTVSKLNGTLLSGLGTGLLKNTTGTGVPFISKVALTEPATGSTITILDGKTFTINNTITIAGTDSTTMTFPSTSATIARTDAGQTFTGTNVFGTVTVTTINALTLTAPATAATFTLANNKTFTVNNTLTMAGTDSTTMTFPTTSATIARTDAGQTFTGVQTMTAPVFSGASVSPSFQPSADGTTAFRIFRANGSTVVIDVDTTDDTAGRLGVGCTPGFSIDACFNGNQQTAIRVQNTTAGTASQVTFTATSDTKTGQFGCLSSTFTTFGLLTANDCDIYAATTIDFVADTATGVLKFAAGGHTEQMRLAATGCLEINMTSCGTSGVFNSTGRVYHTSLTTSGSAQSDALCMNASNEMIEDTVTCIASSIRFKHDVTSLPDGALATVMAMRPVSFFYNATGNPKWDADHSAEQVGFIAEESADQRLVIMGSDGLPRAFAYENYTAILTKAVQEQQQQIERLERRIQALEHPTFYF